MRILLLSFYYEPDIGPGAFRCPELVKQLQQINNTGLQVDVLTTLPHRYASYPMDALNHEQDGNVSI